MIQAGKKIGPFIIEKELGSGAMGTVYRARYEDGRTFALKIISLGMLANETARARFERESDILKQLKHPNIVRLFASGTYKQTPFFAMEYVEGESLDHIMARRMRFSWEEVVLMGKQICAALKHAHERGIIHRDLKPSNLMRLEDGTIKLTDFGIAKDTDVTALTGANCTVGTAAYMSPEQCRGELSLTAKSDLYSLGVVFFELLTGRKPFITESPVDMFWKHVNEPPPRPSRLVDDMIPIWLDTLILQLLEKKPEHRPRDAEMVEKALDEVMEKVNKGQSAAVDAVKARVGDRRYQTTLPDDTDREAARTLRSVIGKKKFRKKGTKGGLLLALKAAGLLALLGILVAGVVYAMKPPSADELFRRSEHLMKSTDTYSEALTRMNRKDGPVREFLRRYPNDPRAAQVADWRDQAEAHDLLSRLRHNSANPKVRHPYPSKIDGNYEAQAFLAMRFEDFGDIWNAAFHWNNAVSIAHGDSQSALGEKVAERRLNDCKKKWDERDDKDPKVYVHSLLEEKLSQARKAKSEQKIKDSQNIADAVVDLYGGEKAKEMDLADLLKEAEELQSKKPTSEKK